MLLKLFCSITPETSPSPSILRKQTQGNIFKEIDIYDGPQFSVMVVLGGLHKASKYMATF